MPPQGLALPLHTLFLKAAETEGYEEILACVLAAEWMYLTWCSTANRSPSSRDYVRDWVTLHAGGAFADHVAWVRAEIDDRGPRLAKARQARLMALFERALEAEIVFLDAPTQLERRDAMLDAAGGLFQASSDAAGRLAPSVPSTGGWARKMSCWRIERA